MMLRLAAIALLLLPAAAMAARELPDPAITPGAINTQVSQANIGQTICAKGWTRGIRPPVSYTNGLKHIKMRQYGFREDQIHEIELDHLIPLSLGGSPEDPHNLWPQARMALLPGGWSAEDKDALEATLRRKVCNHQVSLVEAQTAIRKNWIEAYQTYMSKRAKRNRELSEE